LCDVNYPYRRIAASATVNATKNSNCTIAAKNASPALNQTLAFEASMDLISLNEFLAIPPTATFGTYLSGSKSGHFCVDKGRRTVDGRRLAWLWIFADGKPGKSNKKMSDPPELIWTKAEIVMAYKAANDVTLPMFTRHVEIYPELAITFCLPLP